jgi:hypothetical protein
MACSIPGILGLKGHPPTAIRMCFAVSSDVLPVLVSWIVTEFGPDNFPVASMTCTPAFLRTKLL